MVIIIVVAVIVLIIVVVIVVVAILHKQGKLNGSRKGQIFTHLGAPCDSLPFKSSICFNYLDHLSLNSSLQIVTTRIGLFFEC